MRTVRPSENSPNCTQPRRHIVSASEGPGQGNTSHFEALAGIAISLWRSEPRREERVAPPGLIALVRLGHAPRVGLRQGGELAGVEGVGEHWAETIKDAVSRIAESSILDRYS